MKNLRYLALGIFLIQCSTSGASGNLEDLAGARAAHVEMMIQGCIAAFVDMNIRGYMQRASEAGKPFDSEEAAKAEITSSPLWKADIEPAIRSGCECAYASEIKAINEAKSIQEIEAAVSSVSELKKDPKAAEAWLKEWERCAQEVFDMHKSKRAKK